MRKLIPAVLALCVVLTSAPGFAAEASPWLGTWTLYIAGSKLVGNSLLQLTMDILAADAAKFQYTLDGKLADGRKVRQSYDGKPDGTPHPVLIEGKQVGQASYKWISSRVIQGEASDPNGVKVTLTLELAKDGKSFTETRHVKTAQREYDETMVFRK